MKNFSSAHQDRCFFLRTPVSTLIFRFCLVIFLLCSNTVFAQDAPVTVKLTNSGIKEFFSEVEKQSPYKFLYRDDVVGNIKVNVNKTNTPLNQVLDEVLKGTKISYRLTENNLIIISNQENLQKQRTIRGVVKDNEGEPITGATVVIPRTTIGTTTGLDGDYMLNLPEATSKIIFSYIGMNSKEIALGKSDIINVTMESDNVLLDEVVAIGYAVQKKSMLTGSIASVNTEDFQQLSMANAEEAIQGTVAGVSVTSSSGSPGSAARVKIRGVSSNANTDPLYIIDGVKSKDMNFIDPQDITSMEVLKDAASSAIYGSEGANGVIIVTTKKGKTGKTSIDYNFQYTLMRLGNTPDMLNSEQYATYYKEAGVLNLTADDVRNNTNWMDKFKETGASQRHYLSVTNGNEKSNFALSLSSLSQDGIILGDKDSYKRYTVRFNADTKVNNWLKIGTNNSYSYEKRSAISDNKSAKGAIISALTMDPTTPYSYGDGPLPDHVQSLLDAGKKLVRDENGNIYPISKNLPGDPINPFVRVAIENEQTKISRLNGSTYAELTPIKNLVFTSRFGYDIATNHLKGWEPEWYYNQTNGNFADESSVWVNQENKYFLQWENFVSYKTSFAKKHNLNLLAGISIESKTQETILASGGPMAKENSDYAELNFVTSSTSNMVGGNKYVERKGSYFGRFTYDYDGKYILEGTIRRDGASSAILPKDNRWGVFPSFSAGWVFTEEKFFPESFVSFGKLRLSWGKNGSLSNLSNYMYSSVITSMYQAYQLDDGKLYPVSIPLQLSNNELTWETSVQTNIGLDLRLFSGKVDLSLDYFHKKTTDLITDNTPPAAAGNNPSPINGGDVLNKGFELQASYKNNIRDFKYRIGANFATLSNEVTYLNPSIQRLNGGESKSAAAYFTAFEKGRPVWYFRGYQTDGVDPATGELKFVDRNKDGLINEEDKTYIGSGIPKLTYGFKVDLGWKNFDLTVILDGEADKDIMALWMKPDQTPTNIPAILYNDRWTPENTNAKYPKAGFDPKAVQSDMIVYDGSFMRIKQIKLGYTLPSKLLKKYKLKAIKLYVSLDNYFTFTNYPGIDPKTGSKVSDKMGLDDGIYPVTKSTMFGASISF